MTEDLPMPVGLSPEQSKDFYILSQCTNFHREHFFLVDLRGVDGSMTHIEKNHVGFEPIKSGVFAFLRMS